MLDYFQIQLVPQSSKLWIFSYSYSKRESTGNVGLSPHTVSDQRKTVEHVGISAKSIRADSHDKMPQARGIRLQDFILARSPRSCIEQGCFWSAASFPACGQLPAGSSQALQHQQVVCCVHPQDTSPAGLVLSPNLSHFSVKTLSPYAGTLGLPHMNLGSAVLMTSKIMERGCSEVNPQFPCPTVP